MRLKAVNRPLTYAIRDFSLELKAYVEMDGEGDVRLRSAAPNDTGSSTVHIGFTTITRPMIDENTVPLTLAAAPRLDELGLDAEEQRKLERLGVRNAAQLRRLGQVTGPSTVSRFSGIRVDRLREALQLGRPQVTKVEPDVPEPVVAPPVADGADGRPETVRGHRVRERLEALEPQGEPAVPATPAPPPEKPVVAVAPGTHRLRLAGRNLLGDEGAPTVRLGGQLLPVLDANPERVVVGLPQETSGGELQVEHEDGNVQSFALAVEPGPDTQDYDPWTPES
jgi:hypothetical protein